MGSRNAGSEARAGSCWITLSSSTSAICGDSSESLLPTTTTIERTTRLRRKLRAVAPPLCHLNLAPLSSPAGGSAVCTTGTTGRRKEIPGWILASDRRGSTATMLFDERSGGGGRRRGVGQRRGRARVVRRRAARVRPSLARDASARRGSRGDNSANDDAGVTRNRTPFSTTNKSVRSRSGS